MQQVKQALSVIKFSYRKILVVECLNELAMIKAILSPFYFLKKRSDSIRKYLTAREKNRKAFCRDSDFFDETNSIIVLHAL